MVDFPRLIDLKPAVLTASMIHVHTPLAFVTTPEVHSYSTWQGYILEGAIGLRSVHSFRMSDSAVDGTFTFQWNVPELAFEDPLPLLLVQGLRRCAHVFNKQLINKPNRLNENRSKQEHTPDVVLCLPV